MNRLSLKIGRGLSRYLSEPGRTAGTATPSSIELLAKTLQTCDVLLVEGTSRVSTAIKYLTQSTWSHAALYLGDGTFIEADIVEGVRLVNIQHFDGHHCRICRAVDLSEDHKQRVCEYLKSRLGHQYDVKNIVDLARYLLPTPPVPVRWRRKMLAFGSGDPTRAICSTLIAQAFQSVHYPILPTIEAIQVSSSDDASSASVLEILHVRHFSLFVPRDFDVSPYFQIVKPIIEAGVNYHELNWSFDQNKTELGPQS